MGVGMPPPPTLDQLRAALLEEWDNIPMRINALMNSMHRRIRAATDTRGGWGGGRIRDIVELIDFTLTYINIEKNIRINNIKSPKMLALRFFSLQYIILIRCQKI